MKKRVLAIVCGGNQLLFATQIKHTLFKETPFDIVYMDMDIDIQAAHEIFDMVYLCRTNSAPSKKNALRCFISPKWAIKNHYVDIDPSAYSDVFFYGPTWLYYFLYKFSIKNRHRYKWHILPEGAGAYRTVYPEITVKKYGMIPFKWIFAFLDKYIYGIPNRNIESIEDVYLINPDCSITDNTIPKVSVPRFDPKESDYIDIINRMIHFFPFSIENKIIILDGSLGRSRYGFYDVEKMDELICRIGEKIDKENILLKRSHHIGMEQYDEKVRSKVTFFENGDIPWEIVCINGGIKNCTLISVLSSAFFLPYIFCGFDQQTYLISNRYMPYYLDEDAYKETLLLVDKAVGSNENYHDLDTLQDLENVVNHYLASN